MGLKVFFSFLRHAPSFPPLSLRAFPFFMFLYPTPTARRECVCVACVRAWSTGQSGGWQRFLSFSPVFDRHSRIQRSLRLRRQRTAPAHTVDPTTPHPACPTCAAGSRPEPESARKQKQGVQCTAGKLCADHRPPAAHPPPVPPGDQGRHPRDLVAMPPPNPPPPATWRPRCGCRLRKPQWVAQNGSPSPRTPPAPPAVATAAAAATRCTPAPCAQALARWG